MVRKDKNITPSVTYKIQQLGYNVFEWDDSCSLCNDDIKKVLSKASKNMSGRPGYPDRIYSNEQKKLLVLVEEKPSIKDHENKDIKKGAISGIKWYLSRFLKSNLDKEILSSFDNWKIIGIAVSGDLDIPHANRFSAYYIDRDKESIECFSQLTNFVADDEYLALFDNLDEEKAIDQVSSSSKKINNLLRNIDSQKRPILLSALMISLYEPKDKLGIKRLDSDDFPELYKSYSPSTLASNLIIRVQEVLEIEGIPSNKIKVFTNELSFINTDESLRCNPILKNILLELEESVIPLFNQKFSTNSNYDIIGKFYEEFLRYAGVSNVKKGIVLTPKHIASLFTKLVPMKTNDVILDLACGTGAFLIAAMNEIIRLINNSGLSDAEEKIQSLKHNQLLGFEINPTMYISSISNMLFRNDGKSALFNLDSINDPSVDKIIKEFAPTIGFINPPYSGKENKNNPTPKEITFIEKMLNSVSRYGVVIAPISTYFKDLERRQQILKKHKLKYVINMPGDIFAPNASAHTTIAVFETNCPHNYIEDEVVFYDLKDDGYALVKNKGRSDVYGKWKNIENDLLDAVVRNKVVPDGITLMKKTINEKDEWTVQQHLEVDYSTLNASVFQKTIADFLMFNAKKELSLLNEKVSDFEQYVAFNEYFGGLLPIDALDDKKTIIVDDWKSFNLVGHDGLFPIYDNGKRLTVPNRIDGDTPLITAGEYNQGISQFIGNYSTDQLIHSAITIDMFFNVFYQNFDFAADDNVFYFNNEYIDLYSSLFITSILKLQKNKYGYGRQFRKYNAEDTCLLLPQDENGNPNYKFMSNFIKSLDKEQYLKRYE